MMACVSFAVLMMTTLIWLGNPGNQIHQDAAAQMPWFLGSIFALYIGGPTAEKWVLSRRV